MIVITHDSSIGSTRIIKERYNAPDVSFMFPVFVLTSDVLLCNTTKQYAENLSSTIKASIEYITTTKTQAEL